MKKGKCPPCSVNNMTFCCNQVISSSTFKSQQTNKSYTIFNEVNGSSAYVIYLMECTLQNKQLVGKSETSFNIRLNNHLKDVKKPDAILACRDFQEKRQVSKKTPQSPSKQINLQMLPNQKAFYTKDLMRENFFGFKRCKRYTQKY